MISIDEFLAPVRADAPCGDDPWSTGVLSELETLALGKPETQFSKAEEPDWAALKARAQEVAMGTKDIRVASILAATWLRTDGLSGFRAGVQLLLGYVENFWPDLFPLLDASENNDPSERVNAFSNLSVALGSDGDLLKIIPGVRQVPVLSAPRVGRFSLEHYLVVRELAVWPAEGGTAPTQALLDAAKQEVGAAAVAEVVADVQAILADLKAIEQLFKDKAGPTQFPSFEHLRREFKYLTDWLGGGAAAEAEGGAPAGETATAAAGGEASGGPAIGGAVRNRADVLRALEAVISYYRNCEPSSPVPFILKRAIRIVPMDFLEMMNELTPESRERINSIVGVVEPPANTPSA